MERKERESQRERERERDRGREREKEGMAKLSPAAPLCCTLQTHRSSSRRTHREKQRERERERQRERERERGDASTLPRRPPLLKSSNTQELFQRQPQSGITISKNYEGKT